MTTQLVQLQSLRAKTQLRESSARSAQPSSFSPSSLRALLEHHGFSYLSFVHLPGCRTSSRSPCPRSLFNHSESMLTLPTLTLMKSWHFELYSETWRDSRTRRSKIKRDEGRLDRGNLKKPSPPGLRKSSLDSHTLCTDEEDTNETISFTKNFAICGRVSEKHTTRQTWRKPHMHRTVQNTHRDESNKRNTKRNPVPHPQVGTRASSSHSVDPR